MANIQTWDETHGVRTLTDEEFIAEFGEQRWRDLKGPARTLDPETMTEGQRSLSERMQAEQEVHEAHLERVRAEELAV